MTIAVASGKGGTGKTTIAVNLAWWLSEQGLKAQYLDCDVEEPNGHLFLKPQITESIPAAIQVPVIDESRCVACGECVRSCQYKALARLNKMILVCEELCHGCGGCMRVCPSQAITEKPRAIGVVEAGFSGNIGFVHGRLNVGEALSPPLIRSVLGHLKNETINIIDAPPGTSCPVVAAIRKADFVLLVTEPTPFGLNDLKLALEMVRELSLPHAVVVNRANPTDESARTFCKTHKVEILAEIAEERRVAEIYSTGDIICRELPVHKRYYASLFAAIEKRVCS